MNPVSFGYKCKWLAIRGLTPSKVIGLMPVHATEVQDWSDGIPAAYHGQVFVSPIIEDWVLVVSTSFPDFGANAAAADALIKWVGDVSGRLGTTVQYFMTHRVTESHAWCWADGGKVIRACGWSGELGETVMDLGPKTLAEQDLGLCLPAKQSSEVPDSVRCKTTNNIAFPDEEYVMRLAEKWSVNPSNLEERHPEVGPGWVGKFSSDDS